MSRRRCPKCKEKQEKEKSAADFKFDGRGGVKWLCKTVYYCDSPDCERYGLLTLASVVKEVK